jgi:hypothetical protein
MPIETVVTSGPEEGTRNLSLVMDEAGKTCGVMQRN